jgi:hypothetical protein
MKDEANARLTSELKTAHERWTGAVAKISIQQEQLDAPLRGKQCHTCGNEPKICVPASMQTLAELPKPVMNNPLDIETRPKYSCHTDAELDSHRSANLEKVREKKQRFRKKWNWIYFISCIPRSTCMTQLVKCGPPWNDFFLLG